MTKGLLSTNIVFPQMKLKRKDLFVVVAAFIVFVTYVVKDGLRDQLEAVVTSIDSAENSFLIRSASLPISESLSQIEAQVALLELQLELHEGAPAHKSSESRAQLIEMSHNRNNLDKMESETQQSIDNLERLQKKISVPKALLEKLLTIKKEWDDLRASDNHFLHEVINAGPSDFDSYNEHYLQTLADLNVTYKELEDVSSETMEVAKETKERKESWLRIFTPLSYVLYGIGWTLGLYGKLSGFEETGESD
jgi:hypothetical protein